MIGDANSTQVGGKHYKSPYEHWDLVLRTRMGYLEGVASKYVTRWRQKGGVEDLQKADHYVLKLEENMILRPDPSTRPPIILINTEVARFAKANHLTSDEETIVHHIAQHIPNAPYIRVLIATLIAAEKKRLSGYPVVHVPLSEEDEARIGSAAALAVPLTEENHHAERVEKK